MMEKGFKCDLILPDQQQKIFVRKKKMCVVYVAQSGSLHIRRADDHSSRGTFVLALADITDLFDFCFFIRQNY